jgi:hypothetical protein
MRVATNMAPVYGEAGADATDMIVTGTSQKMGRPPRSRRSAAMRTATITIERLP